MTTTKPETSMTQGELVKRAAGLVPLLKERAAAAEEQRQILPATVDEMRSAGLLRVGNPRRYGGYGGDSDFDAICEVQFELGRACGSTAWCYGVWSSHIWCIGHFALEAQEEYFANGPDVLCSSSYNPARAKLEPAEGGYRVSGRWEFSSGSNAGAWVMLGTIGADGPLWILVPRPDYTVDEDTWFVSGLRGTGSKDIVIDDAFVPTHRTLDPAHAGVDNLTGWELHGRTSYRLPLHAMYGWELAAPSVGIGQGAIEDFTSRLVGTSGRGRTAESVAVQLRLAEASAEVDAARLLERSVLREILDKAARGETFSALEQARYRRDKNYIVRLCVQAVNRLFEASGGHALFDSQPIQRFWRDVQGVAHHTALTWDTAAELYGRLRLEANSGATDQRY